MENKLYAQLVTAGLPFEMVQRLIAQIEQNRKTGSGMFNSTNVGMRGNQNALRVPVSPMSGNRGGVS